MLELRHAYNLLLKDQNVRKLPVEQWKAFVNNVIREKAFTRYTVPTVERHATYIMSHLVGQSTQRNFSQFG